MCPPNSRVRARAREAVDGHVSTTASGWLHWVRHRPFDSPFRLFPNELLHVLQCQRQIILSLDIGDWNLELLIIIFPMLMNREAFGTMEDYMRALVRFAS
jgi:hypothetical protein